MGPKYQHVSCTPPPLPPGGGGGGTSVSNSRPLLSAHAPCCLLTDGGTVCLQVQRPTVGTWSGNLRRVRSSTCSYFSAFLTSFAHLAQRSDLDGTPAQGVRHWAARRLADEECPRREHLRDRGHVQTLRWLCVSSQAHSTCPSTRSRTSTHPFSVLRFGGQDAATTELRSKRFSDRSLSVPLPGNNLAMQMP